MRATSSFAATACILAALLSLAACGGGGGGGGQVGPPDPPPVAPPDPPDDPGPPPDPPTVPPGPLSMRRLTEAQYKASLADVLGEDIAVAGRIEPDNRRSGLLAVGSSYVSVTPSGFEQYDAIARNAAKQALDPAHRSALVTCQPRMAAGADDACAAEFIRTVGRRLLRRPLTDEDVQTRVIIARDSANTLDDFYAGLEIALSTLLVSPEFLFRVEMAEAKAGGGQRFSSLSMASRLSYFLWNTTPDDELLAAGERGDLVDDQALADQVDRLLDSPRLEESVRVLFSDMYDFAQIDQGLVRKDPTLFPAFSQTLMDHAREQTLRTISEHLLTEDGDYRELFTTRKSFMTRTLGVVYRVPVSTRDGFEPYEFPEDSRRAGILTHLSLLSLYSHPGRSSPTLRGKFIREVILCQDVPAPPGDIDFSMFADQAAQNSSTARQRLEAHVANPACAGCHSFMDPLGLALEKMDGIGAEREMENGEVIDASGEMGGRGFDDAPGLGEALAAEPALTSCFVRTVFKYATGRDAASSEAALIDYLDDRFAASGYRLRGLLRAIALSDAFRTTSGPRQAEAAEVSR